MEAFTVRPCPKCGVELDARYGRCVWVNRRGPNGGFPTTNAWILECFVLNNGLPCGFNIAGEVENGVFIAAGEPLISEMRFLAIQMRLRAEEEGQDRKQGDPGE